MRFLLFLEVRIERLDVHSSHDLHVRPCKPVFAPGFWDSGFICSFAGSRARGRLRVSSCRAFGTPSGNEASLELGNFGNA